MLLVECNRCHTKAFADCSCPALGHDPSVAGIHHPACPFTDLGALVTCPPGSGCCDGTPHPGLSHDQAANTCPGGHDSGPCGLGVAGCTGCRPVTITALPGTTVTTAGVS